MTDDYFNRIRGLLTTCWIVLRGLLTRPVPMILAFPRGRQIEVFYLPLLERVNLNAFSLTYYFEFNPAARLT